MRSTAMQGIMWGAMALVALAGAKPSHARQTIPAYGPVPLEPAPTSAPSPAEDNPAPEPVEGRVRWVSPRKGAVLFRPGTLDLAWKSTFPADTAYTVTLGRDGQTFPTVVAHWQNETRAAWTLPDAETVDYDLRVKAMSPSGEVLGADIIPVHVLPRDVIVVSKVNQRLWAFKDGRLRQSFPVSTGMPAHETRAGWHNVYSRQRFHYSILYDAPMPFALFFSGGMAIHASTLIQNLGKPASHGCVRLKYPDAEALFKDSDAGRPVLVTDWGQDMRYLNALRAPSGPPAERPAIAKGPDENGASLASRSEP